jgi:hypothetical protein
MTVTGQWADLINPAFTKIFDDVYARFPEEFSVVFDVMTSTQNYEKFSTATGFGMAVDVDEGEEIPADDPAQGYDSTFTHYKIDRAFHITQEILEDDLYNVMAGKPKALALAVRRKIEDDCRILFDNCTNTTYHTGPDGKALGDGAHPREDGGATQSNETANAFSESAMETGLVAMAEWLDGKGQKINVNPDLLIVPVELDKEARILLESAGRTATTHTNEINPYYGRLDIFVYHWLTSATQWFMLARQPENFLKFIWRRKPALERDDQVSNEVARWFTAARLSLGWVDWRCIYCGDTS